MTLVSLKTTYPDYRNTFSDDSLSHLDDYSVYVDNDNKVGSVEDGLFDDTTGRFRYLIVDTGAWIFGKKVLLPIGKAEFDTNDRRVYV
ncbi:MAG: PRC-barrel domain-containing protein, partial [Phormidesmis sp.]